MTSSIQTALLFVVASKSNPEKSYEIRQGADGVVYCNCPAWKFQRLASGNRTCKHLKSFHAGQLARKETVESKAQAGRDLSLAPKRTAAAKRAQSAHKALLAGNKEVALAVLADPMSANTMRNLALTVLAQ